MNWARQKVAASATVFRGLEIFSRSSVTYVVARLHKPCRKGMQANAHEDTKVPVIAPIRATVRTDR